MMTPIPHMGPEDHHASGVSFDPWMTSPFNTGDVPVPFSGAIYSTSPTSAPQTIADYDPSLFTADCTTPPSASLTTPSFPWEHHNQFEAYFAELGEIHKRVYSTALTVRPVAAHLPPPSINEIFDAACSLVNLMERYAASRHPMSRAQTTEDSAALARPYCASADFDLHHSFEAVSAVSETMEASFCFMALACQQIILGVFQEVLTSFVECLQTLPTAPAHVASSVPQIMITANLSNHLLGQLDQAVWTVISPRVLGRTSASPISPAFSDSSEEFDPAMDMYGGQKQDATASVLRDVEGRRARVQTLVSTVRHLVEHMSAA